MCNTYGNKRGNTAVPDAPTTDLSQPSQEINEEVINPKETKRFQTFPIFRSDGRPLAIPAYDSVRPILQNIVATFKVGVSLVLPDVACRARNAEYNPKRFSAVIMRLRQPRTTALIFSSGKIVVTGAKSEADCDRSSRKFLKILQKLGYESAKRIDYVLQNLVASASLGFSLDLIAMNALNANMITFDPEIFPAAIMRFKSPRATVLVFHTGKIIITGAKEWGHIMEVYEYIAFNLQKFPAKSFNSFDGNG